MLFFFVYVAVIMAALIYVLPLVVRGILTSTCQICLAYFFVVNPLKEGFFEVVWFGDVVLLAWFFVILAALMVIYLHLIFFHGPPAYHSLKLPMSRVSEKVRSRSTLVHVGQVFMAVLFFQAIYLFLILPSVGITPEPPPIVRDFPDWYNLYSLVNAAVWEEVATRLLLIGVPLALGSFAVRLAQALSGSSSMERGTVRFLAGSLGYLLGGRVHESSPATAKVFGAVLILVSATLFGYAHVPAWGAWKFVDAFVAGLALGYLFLRRGIVASILFHFSVNSLGVLTIAAGGEESLIALVVVAVFYLGLVALGSGFFVYYIREVGRLFLRVLGGSKGKVVVGPAPSQRKLSEDLPFFSISCPSCGGHEAIYEEGSLRCSRCGSRL
jgi:hypothetical protein